jgi:hypothetical protein
VDSGGKKTGEFKDIYIKERKALPLSTAKVLLGLGCFGLLVLVGGMATCASCVSSMDQARSVSPAWTVPATDASFRRIGGQGMMDFVVITKKLSSDHAQLLMRLENFCNQERPEWCGVLMWTAESRAPKRPPISRRQLDAEVATYTRNPHTGYDCLQFIKGGDEISHLGRHCSEL